MLDWLAILLVALGLAGPARGPAAPPDGLDRIAAAVEAIESSGGTDPRMWRRDRTGPQGPMQVSAAAAADVGGGDRFAPDRNRAIGRAYLALMFKRYGNWPDAIAAYNWGPGNIDRWVADGRPAAGVSAALHAYLDRVRRRLSTAAPPTPSEPAAVAPASQPDPPAAEIRDPRLRRTYQADRDAVARLREFVAAPPADGEAGAKAALATIRLVASRPGYREFAPARSASPARPPTAALKQIAAVMIARLQAECAAIVLVDRRRQGRP